MDVDVEIISEDGDCPDPLFNSIMNAMNSMKEATADKIYQKIQREGENSYSKPQVERALANALNYGIFEVRNNRYRVRDDILDDEGTVYWKLNKKRMQTPFRGQDDPPPRPPNLNPERDNKRFMDIKKIRQQCMKCGRAKKRSGRDKCIKPKKPVKSKKCVKRKQLQRRKSSKCIPKGKSSRVGKRKKGGTKKKKCRPKSCQKKRTKKVKSQCSKSSRLKKKIKQKKRAAQCKKKKCCETKARIWPDNYSYLKDSPFDESQNNAKNEDLGMIGSGIYDTSDTEVDMVSSPNEQTFRSYRGNISDKYREPRSIFLSDYDDLESFGNNNPKKVKSKDSLKSETCTEKSGLSSVTNRTATPSLSGLNLPSTSKNEKERNQFLAPGGMYDGNQNNKCNEKTDWMSYPDEPQTAIIQTKNVLTIEPMDSLTLKSLDHTSYVS